MHQIGTHSRALLSLNSIAGHGRDRRGAGCVGTWRADGDNPQGAAAARASAGGGARGAEKGRIVRQFLMMKSWHVLLPPLVSLGCVFSEPGGAHGSPARPDLRGRENMGISRHQLQRSPKKVVMGRVGAAPVHPLQLQTMPSPPLC